MIYTNSPIIINQIGGIQSNYYLEVILKENGTYALYITDDQVPNSNGVYIDTLNTLKNNQVLNIKEIK